MLAAIRGDEDIPEAAARVVLSLDGFHVLLRPGERPIGITADDDGHKGHWREASCGTVTFLDSDGGPLHTISSGWMPEHLKGTVKKWLSDAFRVIMEKRPDLTSVGAADGAKDNWSFLSGQEIVDFYHATTYLSKVSEHAVSKVDWYEEWRSVLLEEDEGVDSVLGAIGDLCNRSGGEGGIGNDLELLQRAPRPDAVCGSETPWPTDWIGPCGGRQQDPCRRADEEVGNALEHGRWSSHTGYSLVDQIGSFRPIMGIYGGRIEEEGSCQ